MKKETKRVLKSLLRDLIQGTYLVMFLVTSLLLMVAKAFGGIADIVVWTIFYITGFLSLIKISYLMALDVKKGGKKNV